MSESLVAYGRRIVIRPEAAKERTKGGVILPDAAQEKSQRGEVVSVGDDIGDKLAVGGTVVYSKYAGMITEVDGEDLLVLQEGDILGVIR